MSSKLPRYPKVWTLGHRKTAGIFDGRVSIQEKVDGCVAHGTKILCADLSYRNVEDLSVGDKLVGFTESCGNPKFVKTTVEANIPIEKEILYVHTDKGVVCVSTDHPFLVRDFSRERCEEWKLASELKIGEWIVCLPVWPTENYFKSGNIKTYGPVGIDSSFGVYIYDSSYEDWEKDIFDRLDSINKAKHKKNWSKVFPFLPHGGWEELLRLLGVFARPRLRREVEKLWVDMPVSVAGAAKILSIYKPGETDIVAALTTSSKTYIAEGFFSHNSQISFGSIDGQLHIRSKRVPIYPESPEKLFSIAIETIMKLYEDGLLPDGTVYRAEAFSRAKHNVLEYERMPKGGLVLFDICDNTQEYVTDAEYLRKVAETFNIDVVPMLFEGKIFTPESLMRFLDTESFLGGTPIEGIVIKNYDKFTDDGHPMFAKYVSEKFKEKHTRVVRGGKNKPQAVIDAISSALRTNMRWEKAVRHLEEDGVLEYSPRDIGKLIAEVKRDIQEEEEDWIKEQLYKRFKQHILRKSVYGLAEWYKDRLLKESFSKM